MKNQFLTVMEAGKSKTDVPALTSEKAALLLVRWSLLPCPHMMEDRMARECSLSSMIRMLNPFVRAVMCQKPLLLILLHRGSSFKMNFGEAAIIQTIPCPQTMIIHGAVFTTGRIPESRN